MIRMTPETTIKMNPFQTILKFSNFKKMASQDLSIQKRLIDSIVRHKHST
jgi:hypothetical protein